MAYWSVWIRNHDFRECIWTILKGLHAQLSERSSLPFRGVLRWATNPETTSSTVVIIQVDLFVPIWVGGQTHPANHSPSTHATYSTKGCVKTRHGTKWQTHLRIKFISSTYHRSLANSVQTVLNPDFLHLLGVQESVSFRNPRCCTRLFWLSCFAFLFLHLLWLPAAHSGSFMTLGVVVCKPPSAPDPRSRGVDQGRTICDRAQ